MLTLEIKNTEIEFKVKKIVKDKKISLDKFVTDALTLMINSFKKEDIKYKKRNPLNYCHKISLSYNEELCSNIALTHIEDSASYVHNLRRKRD